MGLVEPPMAATLELQRLRAFDKVREHSFQSLLDRDVPAAALTGEVLISHCTTRLGMSCTFLCRPRPAA